MCRQGSSAPGGLTSARTSRWSSSCSRSGSPGSGPSGGWEEPSGAHDGYPSSSEGGRASAFAATHCRGAREYQFSIEACSAHSVVLHSAQCSTGRLEFPRGHVFCMPCLTKLYGWMSPKFCSITDFLMYVKHFSHAIYIYIQFRVLWCRWFVHDDVCDVF